MTTHPVDQILPTNTLTQHPELAELLTKLAAGIDEVVAFGTHILLWLSEGFEGTTDEAAPPPMMLRHLLELLDSIARLVSVSSIEPCKALLRSVLETYLGLRYLLQRDTEKRSMAFMVCHVHQRLKAHSRFDPSTQMGKQYAAKIGKDVILSASPEIHGTDTSEARANLEKLLRKPRYQAAEREYQRAIASGTSNPNWYSLYDGPKNIEGLADKVGLPGFYEILYRRWSGVVHGTDLLTAKLSTDADGKTYVLALRSPQDAQEVTSLAVSLALHAFDDIMKRFLPEREEALAAWYVTEIRAFSVRVSARPPLIRLADT